MGEFTGRLRLAAGIAVLFGVLMLAGDRFGHREAAGQAEFNGFAGRDLLLADRYVKIKRSKYGHYLTYVEVNDAKIVALVDTGASDFSLTYEDAEKAGLHPFRLKFNKRYYTANGVAYGAEVQLRQVVVDGRIIMRDVKGSVMQKGASRISLLGMTFLNRLTSFSFDRGTLVLEE